LSREVRWRVRGRVDGWMKRNVAQYDGPPFLLVEIPAASPSTHRRGTVGLDR
jgi:hypothetical protein